MKTYFLAIIGGGPAGYTAAEMASKAGKDVVLFEKDSLGGTCLQEGCIPTKTLLYCAKQYYNATHAEKFGLTVWDGAYFDYETIKKRKKIVIRKLEAGIKQRLNNAHCTVVYGEASVSTKEQSTMYNVQCKGEEYEAENVLICTGSTDFLPPIKGIASSFDVWNSSQALNAYDLPHDITIIGGGVIGMEFATLYHEFGRKVVVIEAMDTILPNIDKEISDYLLQSYRKKGIIILTGHKVEEVYGGFVTVKNQHAPADAECEEVVGNKVLVCVGRRANLRGLEGLEGLEIERGGIKVDDFMRTSLPNVYAAGDVTGKIMLAHVASRQAEVAVGRMLKQIPLQRIAYNAIPSVIYTNPEIASVGMTEQQVRDFYTEMEGEAGLAKAGGVEAFYEVKRLPMTFSGRFLAENEGETGLCKVIIDKKNQTILGVHCIGNPASEIIAAASFAVRNGYTVAEFKQVVFPHPTVSEILRETIMK